MHINLVQTWGALRSPACGTDATREILERVRPNETRTYTGVPMVRVIEGELLDKNSGAAPHEVARRWLLNNTAVQRDPDDNNLYIRRAHVAIGSYLDTAIMSGTRGAAHAGLDLYA